MIPLCGHRTDIEYVARCAAARERWGAGSPRVMLVDTGMDDETRRLAEDVCSRLGQGLYTYEEFEKSWRRVYNRMGICYNEEYMFEPGRLSGRPGREKEHAMEDNRLEELCGSVERVVFRNTDNGWTVLELEAGEELHKVVGVLPAVAAGNSSA